MPRAAPFVRHPSSEVVIEELVGQPERLERRYRPENLAAEVTGQADWRQLARLSVQKNLVGSAHSERPIRDVNGPVGQIGEAREKVITDAQHGVGHAARG